QGDDRLPANPSTGGYDAYTISEYEKEHQGESPPENYRDAKRIGHDSATEFNERLIAHMSKK
ncbi:MAG: hypothetical protein AAF065_14585, partial [Verrucomicrobiota bacterium]